MSLDLGNLKTQLKSIFDTANTTTATSDISSGLTTRVQKVLKVNPARIPIQANYFPMITVFVDSKDIELKDFAGNQLMAKREATVSVKIVGAVYKSIQSDAKVDAADDECEKLMENVEDILRRNPTINGVATWQYPTKVTYHNAQIDEGVHIRAGILNLETTILY